MPKTPQKPRRKHLDRSPEVAKLDAPAVITGTDEAPTDEPWEQGRARVQIAVQQTLKDLHQRADSVVRRWEALTEVPEDTRALCLQAYLYGLLEHGNRAVAASHLGLPPAVLEYWLSIRRDRPIEEYENALRIGRGRIADRLEALLLGGPAAPPDGDEGLAWIDPRAKDTTLLQMLQALREEWRPDFDPDQQAKTLPNVAAWPTAWLPLIARQLVAFLRENGVTPAHDEILEDVEAAPANGSGQKLLTAGGDRSALPRGRDDLARYRNRG